MERAVTKLRVLITLFVALNICVSPIYTYGATPIAGFTITIGAGKVPAQGIIQQYINLPSQGKGYLSKPGSSGGSGEYWLPLGLSTTIDNKTKEQIEQELSNLNTYSGNTLTVSLSWDKLKLLPSGHYDFAVLDALLDILKQQSLNAFIVINADKIPYWVSNNCLSYHPAGPEIDPNTGIQVQEHTQPWISNRLSYLATEANSEIEDFVTVLVGRYAVGGTVEASSSAVAGWVLDVGEGYVDNPYQTYLGYEQDSVTAFRNWLQVKYTFISNLNYKWSTSYTDFNSVAMPVPFVKDSITGIYEYVVRDSAAWYDLVQWREYILANWAKNVLQKMITADTKWLTSGDTNHLFSLMVPGDEQGDSDWQYSGIDIAELVSVCNSSSSSSLLDFVCLKCTTDNSQSPSAQWQLVKAKALAKLPILVLLLDADSSLSADLQQKLLISNMWQLYFAGALGVQLSGSNSFSSTSAQWKALSDVTTVMNALKINVRDSSNQVQETTFRNYLFDASSQTADLGFLITDAQDTILNRAEAEIAVLYNALKRLGYQPSFINSSDFVNVTYNSNSNYQALILPRNQKMTDNELAALKAETIKIHANADLPGLMDEYGLVRHTPQIGGVPWSSWRSDINSLFGVDANQNGVDTDLEDTTYVDGYESAAGQVSRLSKQVTCSAISYNSIADMWKYRDSLTGTSGSVIATFSNSAPALVIKDKTAAISPFSLGDSAGNWDWQARNQWLNLIYKDSVTGFGIQPKIDIKGSSSVCVDYLEGANNSILVYLYNYSATATEKVDLQSDFFKDQELSLVYKGTQLTKKSTDGKINNLSIAPGEMLFILSTLPQEEKKDDDKKDDKDDKKDEKTPQEVEDEQRQQEQTPINPDTIYQGDAPILHNSTTTNVIPLLAQATDGSEGVVVSYQIMDGQEDKCSVSQIQYQVVDSNNGKASLASANEPARDKWVDLDIKDVVGATTDLISASDINGKVHTLSWDKVRDSINDTVLSNVKVRIKVTDGKNESNYAESPAFNLSRKWYLAEGAVNGFDEWILITNPHDEIVNVSIKFIEPDGNTIERAGIPIARTSRLTLHVNDFVPEIKGAVAAIVESEIDKGIVVERAMYFDEQTGGHVSLGVPTPAINWYFAEGYLDENFDMWFALLNPDSTNVARVAIDFMSDGIILQKEFSIPALSRYSICAADILPAGAVATRMQVINDVPIVAERAMYWKRTGEENWVDGHANMGMPALSREWYFAEGYTAANGAYREGQMWEFNFSEWLTMLNPSSYDIGVILTFYNKDGLVDYHNCLVPAESRYTVNVTDLVPGEQTAVKMEANGEIAGERSMYWSVAGQQLAGGHCSSGTANPGKVWYLAEGKISNEYDEWIAVFNVSNQQAEVALTIIEANGIIETKNVAVPALARRSIDVKDLIRIDGPISIRVESTVDIVVERVLYWDGDGKRWVGGSCSKGYR